METLELGIICGSRVDGFQRRRLNLESMELDSVAECIIGEKSGGDSECVSGEKRNGEADRNSSPEKANLTDSSAEKTNGDASPTLKPVSPPVAPSEAGDIDAHKEIYTAPAEAKRVERVAQGGEFKVPRFSSRNPPPPPELESSSKFKVPPALPEGFTELEHRLVDSPVRAIPKRNEVVWPPPPRDLSEVSGTAEPRSRPDSAEHQEARREDEENIRCTEEETGIAEKKDNSNSSDRPTSSEHAVGAVTNDAETEVGDASEGTSAAADRANYSHDGSRNPVGVHSSFRGISLTEVEPRAEVGTFTEVKSAAAVRADSERLNGNSSATDLATPPEDAVILAPRQPGAEVGTSTQRKVSAGDRAVSGGPPYVKPPWSAPPGHPFRMEVLKEGVSLGIEDVSQEGAYMFGRSDRCDFMLEHPTISRFHAVLQYNAKGKAFIFDLGSTHGTFINKRQVEGKSYVPLRVGDIIRFGHSTRLYHFQGPTEFIPEEGLSKAERHAVRLLEAAQERAEREQSLLRARRNDASADGATWGMQEDAVEEDDEEDTEEITWQNFKGELTEKQQKTLEKVHKRQEKLANLKKENDAIQAKEISQGGLTQGQQTQIARNEQRMAQIVEELESMEETLNESIREAIVGRTGIRRGGKKSLVQNEEDDDDLSDDEFYDRTSKLQERRKKKEATQVVETAETLLEKKSSLSKEIESVRLLMKAEEEQDKQEEVVKKDAESVDPLDSFMTTISTSIVQDRTARLQKELDSLTKESERIQRLLRIADPTGDSLRKWELKQTPESLSATADLAHKIDRRIFSRKDQAKELASSTDGEKDGASENATQEGISHAKDERTGEKTIDPRPLDPPIRLGAPVSKEEPEEKAANPYGGESGIVAGFIEYKDRKKDKDEPSEESSTAKIVVKGAAVVISEGREPEETGTDKDVASSVALLLKHKRGLGDGGPESHQTTGNAPESSQQPLKKKKIYGPAKPAFMSNAEGKESWVPPAGQTGDGRTALNDKYGY